MKSVLLTAWSWLLPFVHGAERARQHALSYEETDRVKELFHSRENLEKSYDVIKPAEPPLLLWAACMGGHKDIIRYVAGHHPSLIDGETGIIRLTNGGEIHESAGMIQRPPLAAALRLLVPKLSGVRARAASLVSAGMLLASIWGLTSCAYLPQKNITASVLEPSLEEMWGDELMQEVELAPRGIDAKTFEQLAPKKQDELFQLYIKYYYVFPTMARSVTLQSYRKLPATQRAEIEKTYVKTYAAEYPASPAKMHRRFFGSRPLPWLVAYKRIVAQGLLKGLKAQSSDTLFSIYFSNYEAAVHYEIYRSAVRNPAHASRETRKAICAMLNWGHNGRRFDGEGYSKILYFAKPDEIESLGIQKKQIPYNNEDWEIYGLID